jgi:hypothetical protein
MIPFRAIRVVMLCSATIALAGCAAPSSYLGVSLRPGAVDDAIQQQARQAMAGDKQAQLDLKIRVEERMGAARDLTKAKKFYRQAASDSGGTIWVYTPPVGNGTRGRVVTVPSGIKQNGLTVAQRKLQTLEERER